ncbi:hypothetical protein AVEN_169172-1 [Araneus ventricosus]|uniref:Uncharacterized protein n=1 Tax=Araneus ventricosus TaxID=182803 RepID=A0A4Y2WP80_ARAVE|nr:hypothetical protein AVEN_169172-1 [Araneus ventricosus]
MGRPHIDRVKDGHSGGDCTRAFAAHGSTLQPIHLGRPFIQTPCKSRNQSLLSSRVTVFTPPPAFKSESSPRFPERASLHLPPYYGFRFCERDSLKFFTVVFQFYDPPRRMKNRTEAVGKQPFLRLKLHSFELHSGAAHDWRDFLIWLFFAFSQ